MILSYFWSALLLSFWIREISISELVNMLQRRRARAHCGTKQSVTVCRLRP